MAMFKNTSKGRIQLTPEEEAERLAEVAQSISDAAIAEVSRKRERLIQFERDAAIETLISTKKTVIEVMNESALNASMTAKGLK